MADEHLAYERQRAFIEEYHLAEHDPRLAQLLRAIRTGAPHTIDRRLMAAVGAQCAPYTAFHHEIPFITAPARALASGTPFVMRQYANHTPVCLTEDEEARGVIAMGSAGSGKTALLLQAADRGLQRHHEWIVDVKSDAPGLAHRHDHLLVITNRAPIDLFATPPYGTTHEYLALLLESIARTMYVGQTGKSILHDALTTLYGEHDHPTLRALLAILERMPHKGDPYDRRNTITNLALRVRRLADNYPGIAQPGGVPLYRLCTKSVLWSFNAYTDLEDLLLTLAVNVLFQHHRHHNTRRLTTVVHVDEALLAFRAENHSRINGNPLSELIGLTREFGISWRLSVNTLALLDPAVIANTFVLIALNVNSGAEHQAVTRTFGLTKEQAAYYATRLTRGHALVRLGDRWRHPMLCTYDPLPFPKTISTAAWDAALARITTLAHTPPEGNRTRATPNAVQPLIPPNATTSTPNPVRRDATPVALNAHATALLSYVALHGVVLTTEAFRDLQLHPQAGTRVKQTLLALGLLEEERIVVRGTGRGRTGVAIRPTSTGYERAGMTRVRMRPCSLQHEHLVRRLAQRLPDATIELSIAGKSCDLVLVYHDGYARLATFAGITPKPGDVIAIEVEVSAAAQTGKNNVEKNRAVGVFTILATLTPLRRPPLGAVVVDVFALLEAL